MHETEKSEAECEKTSGSSFTERLCIRHRWVLLPPVQCGAIESDPTDGWTNPIGSVIDPARG